MKVRLVSFTLLILLVTSCSINVNNVQKKITKLHKKDKVVDLLRKVYLKNDLQELEIILNEISLNNYQSERLNNFLRDDLIHKLKESPQLQLLTTKAIINQNSSSNIRFFFETVLTKYPILTPEIENAVANFGESQIVEWQDYLVRPEYFQVIIEILNKYDSIPIEFIFEKYLAKPQEILLRYIKVFQSETTTMIADRIEKGKSLGDLKPFLAQIDSHNLILYKKIIQASDVSQISIVKDIFSYYKNEALVSIDSLYREFSEYEYRQYLIEMCEHINTRESRNYLINKLKIAEDYKEIKKLVQSISNVSIDFPLEFLPFLEDLTKYYDIQQTIYKFLEQNKNSIITAYTKASNIGKARFLSIFFEENPENILSDVSILLKNEDKLIQETFLLKALLNQYIDSNVIVICENLLLDNSNKRFYLALNYALSFKPSFLDFVLMNYNSIVSIEERKYQLLSFFYNPSEENEIKFIFDLFADTKDLRFKSEIAKLIADDIRLVNDIPKFLLLSNDKDRKKILEIIGYIDNKSVAKTSFLNEFVVTEYSSFSIEERLVILSFSERNCIDELCDFFINIFDEMSLVEQTFFLQSLSSFEWDFVWPIIRKILRIGNPQQFEATKRRIDIEKDLYAKQNDFLESMLIYYFRQNEYIIVGSYLDSINVSNKKIDIIRDLFELNKLSISYMDKYRNNFEKYPVNYVTLVKDLYDTLWVNDYYLNYESIEEDYKKKLFKKNNKILNEIENYKSLFDSYFMYIQSNEDLELYRDINIQLLNSAFLTHMNVGFTTLSPSENSIFLEVSIMIENQSSSYKNLILNDLYLENESADKYSASWKQNYNMMFHERQYSSLITLDTKEQRIIKLIFEVKISDKLLTVKYKTNTINNALIPIKIESVYTPPNLKSE